MRSAVLFLFRLNILFGVYGGAMVWIFADPFIGLWMGPGYESSGTVARVLVTASMLQFAVGPLVSVVYAVGTFKPLALATAIEAALNLAASLWLGSRVGVIGVAWGTLVPLLLVRIAIVTPWAASLAGIKPRELLTAAFRPVVVAAATIAVLSSVSPGGTPLAYRGGRASWHCAASGPSFRWRTGHSF